MLQGLVSALGIYTSPHTAHNLPRYFNTYEEIKMHLFLLLAWWNGFWRVSRHFFLLLLDEPDESFSRNACYVIFQMRIFSLLFRWAKRSDKNISVDWLCYRSCCSAYFPYLAKIKAGLYVNHAACVSLFPPGNL
jgi:hypothetical protein